VPRRPGRPRSAELDAAILDAALDLLIDRGVGETSIEQVAGRAGVTRATVYRRFPDKIQLLIAAIHREHRTEELPSEPVDVEEMLAWWAEALSKPRLRRLTRRLMSSLHDYPALREAYWNASIKHREQLVRSTLEQAYREGRFPPETDLEIVQKILSGAVSYHLAAHPDTCTKEEVEEFLLAVVRQTGLRARS